MKTFAFVFVFVAGIFSVSGLVTEAMEAYAKGDYLTAALKFQEAVGHSHYDGKEQPLYYNVAQSYLLTDSATIAQRFPGDPSDSSGVKPSPQNFALRYFSNATKGGDKFISSEAWNNVGVLLAMDQEIEPALEAFREAMRKFPDNSVARYNYELLLKKQQQQQQENQDQEKPENQEQEKNDDQQNQDQQEKQDQNQDQNQDKNQPDQQNQQEKEKEEKDGQSGNQENQKPKNSENSGEQQEHREIPMDQAKMLLEAMNENEKKFLQQLRKKPNVKTKPEQSGRDW